MAIEAPFAATFPLPFRVMLLGGVGILCWALNLHGLELLGVDVMDALEVKTHDNHHLPSAVRSRQSARSLYLSTYRVFIAYSAWGFLGWTLFRIYTRGSLDLVDHYKFIPAVFGLVAVMALISPFNNFHKRERDVFLM